MLDVCGKVTECLTARFRAGYFWVSWDGLMTLRTPRISSGVNVTSHQPRPRVENYIKWQYILPPVRQRCDFASGIDPLPLEAVSSGTICTN